MENSQEIGSSPAQRILTADVDCVIDQVKIKAVWQQKPKCIKASSETVDNKSFLDDKSAENTSNLLDQISNSTSPEKSLDPENYEVSIFSSSTPAKKGPLMRRMEKLAFNDVVSAKYSPIQSVEAIIKKIDFLQLSVFHSSTPVQQTAYVRRFEKLGLNEYFKHHFSPISSEPEICFKQASTANNQNTKSCNRKLAF